MNRSVPLLLRSRLFHHHVVCSKAKPLFREERLPSSKHTDTVTRSGGDSSSGESKKKHSKLDTKLTTKKKFSNRTTDEKNVPEKVNIISKKQQRKTHIEINEIAAEKMVLYKDNDIVALNKPGGLAVHSGPKMSNDLSCYLHHWQYGADQPPELAHRLDKDTSGVLLLTRHKEAARKLARLFKERKVIKKYWAVVVSVPEHLEGVIQIPLSTKNIAASGSMTRVVLRTDKMFAYTPATLGKTLTGGVAMAETRYVVQGVSSLAPSRCCLVEVTPVTGFKHQIRVHLADGINCPILGDHKFAGPVLRASAQLKKKVEGISKTSHLHLHAREITIPGYLASTGKPLVIKAPPPKYFVKTATEQGLHLSSP